MKEEAMRFLLIRAFGMLLIFEFLLLRGNFSALYSRVGNSPVRQEIPGHDVVRRVVSAIDLVCIWYPKQVLCLQRSAATTCMLRRYGIPAQLVVGAQQLPFRAHAWVEVDGSVVNDKPYISEMYATLTRC
jgi:hypothetical protein